MRNFSRLLGSVLPALLVGCGSSGGEVPAGDAGPNDGAVAEDASTSDGSSGGGGADATPDAVADGSSRDGGVEAGGEAGPPCSTRIQYGSAWIHPTNHPSQVDVAAGEVSWDGTCTDSGGNSTATLSNGWKPVFQGHGACVLAFDTTGCTGSASACATRITYGPAWLPPPNHPTSHDDVAGRVFADGVCAANGGNSVETLSNGWAPTFQGGGSCSLSFRYSQCGGLYANPVIPTDCPDPGVLRDGSTYVLTCTSGNAADAYPIYTSPDLVTWTPAGHVFPQARKPSWAVSDFWAPEIHRVGGHYVVYFSARGSDGKLAIGVASAPSATGPFTAPGQPLVHDASMGLIDASEIDAPGGPYVLWKEDGNAVGQPTPIHAQPLDATGMTLTGSPSTLITNDQAWEGAVTEGPFMVAHGGEYFLFYSGNSYASATYAVGVARAPSPTGPFTKAPGPIVVTGGAWVGPGHCSVVDTPAGDWAMVYHAWKQGCVNGPGCGREDLVDLVDWSSAFPSVPFAPSSADRPVP